MKSLLSVILILLTGFASAQMTDAERQERLEVLRGLTGRFGRRDIHEIIYALSPEDKQILIDYYRAEIVRLNSLPNDTGGRFDRKVNLPTAHDGLAKLGDPEELNRLLAIAKEKPIDDPEYLLAPGPSLSVVGQLIDSGRPEIMIELAPLMFLDEEDAVKKFNERVSVTRLIPKSISSTGAMLGIMQKSPAFSAETRAWAMKHPFDERSRAAVRRWWKENEEYFKAGDYKAVKPGEDIYSIKMAERRQREKEAQPIIEQKKREFAALEQSRNATPNPVAVVPIPAAEPRDSAFGYALTAGILVVLASGIWVFRSSAVKRN